MLLVDLSAASTEQGMRLFMPAVVVRAPTALWKLGRVMEIHQLTAGSALGLRGPHVAPHGAESKALPDAHDV